MIEVVAKLKPEQNSVYLNGENVECFIEFINRFKAEDSISRKSSFVLCKGLVNGHISCRGMNLEFERLIELEGAEKLIKRETKMEEDIADQEIVVFYENTKQTIINKFKKPKKRKRAYYEGEENGKIKKGIN